MKNWLRRFLHLGAQPSEAVITGYRRPLGYQQLSSGDLATAVGLTMPTLLGGQSTGLALVQSYGGVVRWRDDGEDPDASTGMTILDGGELHYTGDLTKIKFILSVDTPELNISIYQ